MDIKIGDIVNPADVPLRCDLDKMPPFNDAPGVYRVVSVDAAGVPTVAWEPLPK